MSKRETVESKIISYFQDEPDERVVTLLFGIIKGIVAKRTPKKKAAPSTSKRTVKEEPKGNSETDALPGLSTH